MLAAFTVIVDSPHWPAFMNAATVVCVVVLPAGKSVNAYWHFEVVEALVAVTLVAFKSCPLPQSNSTFEGAVAMPVIVVEGAKLSALGSPTVTVLGVMRLHTAISGRLE